MRSDRTYIRTDELHAEALLAELGDVYERGWQPADIVHLTARSGDETDVSLAALTVLFDARRTRAAERAPDDWLRQVRAIADRHPGLARIAALTPDLGTGLRRAYPEASRYQVDGLAFTWKYLPAFTRLDAPPSQWPPLRAPGADSAAPDPRVLERIRGLLSKAESTDFPDEAEALTAKAQELVTRYALGSALLTGTTRLADPVRGRRLHLDGPYIKEKVLLLTAIGDANRVRTVWFTRVQIATVVGTVSDLVQVELLFTSLLVQATRALGAAGTAGRRGGSATAFRRAFLTGYAKRVGERLREADARATASAASDAHVPVTSLAPILARRSEAVDTEFRRLFPTTRASRSRGIDADGFHAGRDAAESASLATRQPRIER
ncbi:DUF2786 domain-containing protein [Rhodococcus coprophilus]|uniref:Protein of uncharacterized function (DUF2786) n=1 Tax=Rhodococcus coprophilus TaxID=38310 RepID=A0A2X4TSW8_9NOCA|nr:DUF2786 domain-containing protein [Rhodococcus coprophilus]MBM7457874.1 hypothetical protein [Rhodococcus coprophilus]SQI30496.1 Protein of uncharacterised function (DUF2786) [Rhodococcus coprophilus]